MSSPVSTTLSMLFGEGNTGQLQLENGGDFVGLNSVPMALLDTMTTGVLSLHATIGDIRDTGRLVTKHYPGDFNQIDGADFITVPEGAGYSIEFALRENGTRFMPAPTHKEGTVQYFNERFWGLVAITPYTRQLKLLQYTPNKIGGGGSAVVIQYGSVAAFRAGRLVVCDVNPASFFSGHDENEVYRVESQALINSEGEWEVPNGWPNTPSYPNGATPPKPRVGVLTTRVHEIGMVTNTGLFWSRTFGVMPQRPYQGDPNYTPPTSITKGVGFSKLSRELQIKAMEIMEARGKGAYK